MHNRTFLRTMLDIVFQNAFVKTIAEIVNFCDEHRTLYNKKLKFFKKMPINNNEKLYSDKFLFNGKWKVENGK